jgi:putative flippase GtrA
MSFPKRIVQFVSEVRADGSAQNGRIVSHIFKYIIVGLSGALLDVGTFFLLFQWIHIPYLAANIVSSHVGIVNNFLFNSAFTFGVTDGRGRRFLVYYCVALTGIGVGSALLYVFVTLFAIHPLPSKILALAIVTSAQFLANEFITFRRTR